HSCRRTLTRVTVLLATHPTFAAHLDSVRHPERPQRLVAVLAGIAEAPTRDAVVAYAPRRATVEELARVHDRAVLETLQAFCEAGGGRIDQDTAATVESW